MSNLIEHAKREFLALGYKPIEEEEDGPNKWIQENVLELLRVFSEQGHSGSSAPYCVGMFNKLAMFEPLGPLTGEDHEWNEVGDGVFQNKRCSHVFKQADLFNGQAYDINGRVFREANGCCYTNIESFVPVTFPYTPKTEYVDEEPKPHDEYVEQNIVSVLREYADAAEADEKPHWAKAMREAAKQLRSGIEAATKSNGSSEDDLHVCGQCNGTGYVA